jgi:prepilin-type N-terminal cleavage/methylation domain-containing protein
MKLPKSNRGFTLIELLVVVSIIALLAVAVVPHFGKIMLRMKANSAMQQARSIFQMLYTYAQQNDQVFPQQTADGGEIQTSNDAFRQLFIKGLVDDEKVFFVKGSGWHGTKTKPDGDIGTPDDNYAQAVAAGENHWGYVTGLTTDRDDSTLPVVMDGGVDGSPGRWTREPKERGGQWKGLYAVTVRVGGSAAVTDLDNTLTVKDKKNGTEMDIFSDAFGTTPDNAKNPLGE